MYGESFVVCANVLRDSSLVILLVYFSLFSLNLYCYSSLESRCLVVSLSICNLRCGKNTHFYKLQLEKRHTLLGCVLRLFLNDETIWLFRVCNLRIRNEQVLRPSYMLRTNAGDSSIASQHVYSKMGL